MKSEGFSSAVSINSSQETIPFAALNGPHHERSINCFQRLYTIGHCPNLLHPGAGLKITKITLTRESMCWR
jgi:hypothetical protein